MTTAKELPGSITWNYVWATLAAKLGVELGPIMESPVQALGGHKLVAQSRQLLPGQLAMMNVTAPTRHEDGPKTLYPYQLEAFLLEGMGEDPETPGVAFIARYAML